MASAAVVPRDTASAAAILSVFATSMQIGLRKQVFLGRL
jgi:hypothetical protein